MIILSVIYCQAVWSHQSELKQYTIKSYQFLADENYLKDAKGGKIIYVLQKLKPEWKGKGIEESRKHNKIMRK